MKLKPYDLVWVKVATKHAEQGSYSYIGQVISYEYDSGKIKVRRTPGHSGTMEEQLVTNLSLPTSGPKHRYVEYAEVEGFGQFPVDMLRYDSCAPVNFALETDDRFEFDRIKAVIDESFGFTKTLIVSKASTKASGAHWTPERWKSFGWRIKPFKVEAI
jgi:hypothetical protein